jgi:hypothetical protein
MCFRAIFQISEFQDLKKKLQINQRFKNIKKKYLIDLNFSKNETPM